jgi:anti-sigma B factor antagonist
MNMALEKTIEKRDKLYCLFLKGELDLTVAEELIEQVRELCEQGGAHFYFDLAEVQTIDSSGLGSLIRILTIVRKLDGTVHLRKPPPRAFRVFEITRLDSFFPFVESAEEAQQIIKNLPEEPLLD